MNAGRRLHSSLRRAALSCALALAVPAIAAGQERTHQLSATTQPAPYISLAFFGQEGSDVSFFEVRDEQVVALARRTISPGGIEAVLRVVAWECDRRTRTFLATGTSPGGEALRSRFSVQTPACTNRMIVRAPRRVKVGAPVTVRVQDRWKLGDQRVTACVHGAGIRRTCRTVKPGARAVRLGTFRARRPGRVRVALAYAKQRQVTYLAAGNARVRATPNAPVVLITGDSTIQATDSHLADFLGSSINPVLRNYPGTGITAPASTTWMQRARTDAARHKPRVTVLSLGGLDAFALPTPAGPVECCEEPWISAYTRRAQDIVRAYTRNGNGKLVWLSLPMPRDPRRQPPTTAVNAAIQRAVATDPNARYLDISPVISPGDRYHDTVTVNDRAINVRAEDGIHLSPAGGRLAALTVRDFLDRTGWLD